ncbi:retrotransposon-related protein [Tanacetum coccineum]
MTKVEFPKFSGDDVKGWIFMCEQFFDIDDILEHHVKLIYVHLFDIALLWHKQFIRLNSEAVSWNVYKKGILQRFGTVFDDPISEMRKIKYQSNAKDYQDAFDTLLSRVDVSEEHAVSFYLGGLPAEIEKGKYTPGHKCSGRLFSIVLLADEEWENEEEYMEKENPIPEEPDFGRSYVHHLFVGLETMKQKLFYFAKQRVGTDPSKIKAMQDWPVPNNVKQLRGFLGLTGYYRRFIINVFSEFLDVLLALEKWRGYLLDRHFIIRTDHFSLKYLLDQKITTPTQMKWLPKLMGFDYEVIYKKGSDNAAADALSIVQSAELLSMNGQEAKRHYVWSNSQLTRKGKIVVGNNPELRKELLKHFHEGVVGGHSGVKVTTHKICLMLYWKGLKKQVKQYVRECLVCQICKPDLAAYPDLVHPFNAQHVAQAFLDNVYKLHGLPESIVSDRDKVFLSKFWSELFKLLQFWYLSVDDPVNTDSDSDVDEVLNETSSFMASTSSKINKSSKSGGVVKNKSLYEHGKRFTMKTRTMMMTLMIVV